MLKRKLYILLSIFSLLSLFFFTRNIIDPFGGSTNRTSIEFNQTHQENIEKIKAIISDKTHLLPDAIQIKNSNDMLTFYFTGVDKEIIDAIEIATLDAMGESGRIMTSTTIGKPTKLIGYYVVLTIAALLFLLSLLTLITNLVAILKERQTAEN